MGLPNATYIDAFINDGNSETISLNNLYETKLIGNADNPNHIYRVPWSDFFIKYKTQLDKIVSLYSVPEERFYKPKMVSYELYGTTELWLGLLRLNNMRNTSEFYLPIIKIYNPYQIKELIDIFFKREGIIT